MEITANLREALKLLGTYTAGKYDLWLLAGSSRASCRAHVMTVLMGARIPQSKAGVNALRDALYRAAGIEGDCLAEKNDKFIHFGKTMP